MSESLASGQSPLLVCNTDLCILKTLTLTVRTLDMNEIMLALNEHLIVVEQVQYINIIVILFLTIYI